MDNILLCSNHIPLVTSIHNTFIEKYMLGANGSYVKVYLYLSKCIQSGEEDLSISSLADKMENTEKDIIRALNYWEKQKLLKITRSEDKSVILGIDVLNPDELPAADVSEPSRPKKKHTENTSSFKQEKTDGSLHTGKTADSQQEKVSSTASADVVKPETEPSPSSNGNSVVSGQPEVIAMVDVPVKKSANRQHSFHVTPEQTKRLASDEEFRWTCNVVESYLERPVKPGELQLLSYLYDNLHFSSELILHLYEYCISLGKTSTSYIQSVAIAWDEKQIKTPEEAQNASANYNASYTAVSKAFALGRALAVIEKRYVERWQTEWQMDLSVILEACNRTMLKIQRADFKYTEGILDNWHKAGIHTLIDVEKADEAYAKNKAAKKASQTKTAQGNNPQSKNRYSSYVQHGLTQDDANELEKKLLSL